MVLTQCESCPVRSFLVLTQCEFCQELVWSFCGRVDSRLVTIDERFCVTVQAISPVQEMGISHVGQAVFVIEPDRQQAIVIQCLSALEAELGSSLLIHLVCKGVSLEVQVSIHVESNGQ